jgi:hypothetical protein
LCDRHLAPLTTCTQSCPERVLFKPHFGPIGPTRQYLNRPKSAGRPFTGRQPLQAPTWLLPHASTA